MGPKTRRILGALCLVLVQTGPAGGQALFRDVSGERGIRAYRPERGVASGVAAADYDGDGLVDIFVPQAAGVPDQLYRNLGDGTFEEVAAAARLDVTESSRAALWVDHDGDGDLDLFVANDDPAAPTAFRFYLQEAGRFTDVTRRAGVFKTPLILDEHHHWGGICAGDINNDEYLDIYTVQWPGPGHMFLNNRDGTFSDISEASGLAEPAFMHQPVMADFDGDGWLDIYVAVDFHQNRLWINQRDATFVNLASEARAANAMNDMGVTLGDYDNDGDLDIYVTNIYIEAVCFHNVLLRNESSTEGLRFRDVSFRMGVDNGHFGWGTTFIDVNNDGNLDIAATNGWDGPRAPRWPDDPSLLFLNQDAGRSPFLDVSAAVGFDDMDYGSSLVTFDFDRDGDLDLLQTVMEGELRLLENEPSAESEGRNYLVVRPRSTGRNRFAIGAVVRARVGETRLTRWITSGTSYMGQEPAEAFFGLGRATSVSELTVEWPGGARTTLSDVAANQVLTVTPPAPQFRRADANADGRVDISDGIRILGFLFLGHESPPCLDAADADDSGSLELTDGLWVLRFLFERGESSVPGAVECAGDSTDDALDCAAFGPCDG